jgi:hypothetical protein
MTKIFQPNAAPPVGPQVFSKGTALVAVLAGGPVKTTSWSLIVMSPHSWSLEKIRLSCKLGVILVGAFVFAFLTTTLLCLMFPRIRVDEPDRVRSAAENQTLSENKHLVPEFRKLHAELSRVAER